MSCLLLLQENKILDPRNTTPMQCIRYERIYVWWNLIWETYSEKRFKQAFRVSRYTFQAILVIIRTDLQKQIITEDPTSPEMRLAVCPFRLVRSFTTMESLNSLDLGVNSVSNY